MSLARIITAFLVAPLMTPLVLLGAEHLPGAPFNLAGDLGLFIVVAGFAYVATALFGIPAFFLFLTKHWTSVFLYVLVGGLVGLTVSMVINHRISFDVWDQGFRLRCIVAGALSALVFRMLSGMKFDHVSSTPTNGET